jgi:hypothetical protein
VGAQKSAVSLTWRLFISERTVHHHVSAVLGKLGVSSPADIPPTQPSPTARGRNGQSDRQRGQRRSMSGSVRRS